MIDPAIARKLVQWGRDNLLVFDPLPCEANQSAIKIKQKTDQILLDKKIDAKR